MPGYAHRVRFSVDETGRASGVVENRLRVRLWT